MSAFLRYMASLALHIAWQRTGNRGGVPPIRLPRGKGPVNLPVIGPWQMMIAMWILRKMWAAYGDDVKGHMLRSRNKFINQVGSSLPGVSAPPDAAADDDDNAPVAAASVRPRATLDTQPLPGQANAKPGSVLSRLRGSASAG